jgi:hypothetical protein
MKQKDFNHKISILQKIKIADGIGGFSETWSTMQTINTGVHKVKIQNYETKNVKTIKTFYDFTINSTNCNFDISYRVSYQNKIYEILDINPLKTSLRTNYYIINCVSLV